MVNDCLYHPYWYAIQTRSRHEKIARDQLAAKGITHLLPLWRKRSVWKDRIKVVEFPLFSGYLFGYFALSQKIAVLEVPGIVRIVGLGGQPIPVPDDQIEAIQAIVTQRLSYDPHPYLTEGMRVRIKHGVLAGIEGLLVTKKQQQRLVISVDLIQQSVIVDIASAEVEPVYQNDRKRGALEAPASR
jgi:transcription termination/antitermination protein NusG